MTLEQRIAALATALGADYKALNLIVGALAGLNTSNKTSIVNAINSLVTAQGNLAQLQTSDTASLVAAINELYTMVESASGINDAASSTTTVYSSSKTQDLLTALKNELLGGTPVAAFDTLKELADYVQSDQSAATAMATAINNRVRFDEPQALTPVQQLQACQNIGVGNPDADFVATYSAAKA